MTHHSDTARIRRRFDAVADRYDAHAVVFDTVGERLLERLDGLNFRPGRILDLGGGTGGHALALRDRYPDAQLVVLDGSLGMLRRATRRRGRWRPKFERIAGDFQALPLADASVDLAFANLALQCRLKTI